MTNPDKTMQESTERPSDIGERGRFIYGKTPPSAAVPCQRSTPLSPAEIDEVVDIIFQGRTERRAVELPERLRTRDWASVLRVVLALDVRRARRGVGWKIGAASQEIRIAEGLPALLRAGSTRGRCSPAARPWGLNCSSIIAT